MRPGHADGDQSVPHPADQKIFRPASMPSTRRPSTRCANLAGRAPESSLGADERTMRRPTVSNETAAERFRPRKLGHAYVPPLCAALGRTKASPPGHGCASRIRSESALMPMLILRGPLRAAILPAGQSRAAPRRHAGCTSALRSAAYDYPTDRDEASSRLGTRPPLRSSPVITE